MRNKSTATQAQDPYEPSLPHASARKAAFDACTALTTCQPRSIDFYRFRKVVIENLDQLFPPEHRTERIQAAAGGRDPAGQAVRYLRTVGWEELSILLKTGKIEFPQLHPTIDQTLSPVHARRLRSIFKDHPVESEAASRLLGAALQEKIDTLNYREAIYLCAASIPLDRILMEHACGRGGGQVFSPFLSTTTGGPMINPVSHGVSIETLIPFPRAFPNWLNTSVEQETLLTELKFEDISRIYHDEDKIMDDLLASDSQLASILPEEMAERSYHRYSPYALTCWRSVDRNLLLPEVWQGSIEDRESAKIHLREAYRNWGLQGFRSGISAQVSSLSEAMIAH